MIRIALCCGSSEFLKTMHRFVSDEFAEREIDGFQIDEFSTGKSLLLRHNSEPYDVIFLDIDMPEMTGYDLAKELNSISDKCDIIFVSCYSEFTFDNLYFSPLNFNAEGSDELIKTKLHNVTDQLLQHIRQNKNLDLINNEQDKKSVRLKDILYIESDKHYIIYHISEKKQIFRVRDSISRLQEQLFEYDFIRVHRQYLVNLRHISGINRTNDTIIFKQGFELPMSKKRKADVNEKLTDFFKNTK